MSGRNPPPREDEVVFLNASILNEINARLSNTPRINDVDVAEIPPIITEDFIARLKVIWLSKIKVQHGETAATRFNDVVTKDLLKRLGNALMKEKDHKDTQKLMNSKNLVIYKVPVKPPSGAAKRKKRKQKELDQQGANELQANIIVDPYANEKISIKDFINQANTIIKSEVLISQENIEKVKPIFDQLEIYFKSLLHLASEKQDINDILIEIEKMQNLICDKIGIGTSWVLAWVEKRGTTSEVPKITRMLDQKVPRRLLVADRSGPRNNRENASTVKGGIDEFGSSIRKRMKTLSKQIHIIAELMTEKQKRHEEINNYKLKATTSTSAETDIDLEISRIKNTIDISVAALEEQYKRLRELEIAKHIREDSSTIMKTQYMILISNSTGKTFSIVNDKNDYDVTIERLFLGRYGNFGIDEQNYILTDKRRKIIFDRKHKVYDAITTKTLKTPKTSKTPKIKKAKIPDVTPNNILTGSASSSSSSDSDS